MTCLSITTTDDQTGCPTKFELCPKGAPQLGQLTFERLRPDTVWMTMAWHNEARASMTLDPKSIRELRDFFIKLADTFPPAYLIPPYLQG